MAKSTSGDSAGFDLDKFRRLLQLMEKYGVTETQLTKGEESWKVRRGPRVAAAPAAAPLAIPAASEAPAPVERGFERELKKRLDYFAKLRSQRND